MNPTNHDKRFVDVTGLSEDGIRAVESLAAVLREQTNANRAHQSVPDWCRALREWAESHEPRDTVADWGRESIYAGRGE